MKYMFIGDIHGNTEVVEEVLSEKYKEYYKVFVGDYVDSYDRSVEDQMEVLGKLLDAVVDRKDVTCLLGNHEYSYLVPRMRCSGYDWQKASMINPLIESILGLFKTHFWVSEDILVTHAGATAPLFSNLHFREGCWMYQSKEGIAAALRTNDDKLYNIGYARGGGNTYGGIFWCDYWKEFKPIEGLIQIVGHSSYRPKGFDAGIVHEEWSYNIDCLLRVAEVLLYDTEEKEFSIKNLITNEEEKVE